MKVVSGTIVVSNRKKKELLAELQKKKYQQFPKKGCVLTNHALAKFVAKAKKSEEESEEENGDVLSTGYDYLLSMPLWSLTLEKVACCCNRPSLFQSPFLLFPSLGNVLRLVSYCCYNSSVSKPHSRFVHSMLG